MHFLKRYVCLIDINLLININRRPDDDNEQLEQLTLQLNEDLRELDVDKVELIRKGDAPTGAKGDVMTWGSILVTLVPGILPNVINTIRSWITSHGDRSIKMKIGDDVLELKGIPDHEEQRLIDRWINLHK
jgi:hypothetical protein